MSPKNAIKMINIQKYYLVHIGPIRSILPLWFYSVHIVLFGLGSIRSTLVHFAHFGSIRSTLSYLVLVLFGPICSYSVHIGPLCPIQSTLVLFSPPCSYSVLLCPFNPPCSIWSICVHFGPFRTLRFI